MKIQYNTHTMLKSYDKGFTLVEMLMVIALIGVIGSIVTVNIIGKFDQARVDTTKIQIRALGQALNQFRIDCGFYPTTEQGLDALLEKPGGRECKNYSPDGYLGSNKLPEDGWDNYFVYESDGRKYEIKSLGADEQEGGDGLDADISSNDIN